MWAWFSVYAKYMWSDNKVRELIAVEVLYTSLLNTTMVALSPQGLKPQEGVFALDGKPKARTI